MKKTGREDYIFTWDETNETGNPGAPYGAQLDDSVSQPASAPQSSGLGAPASAAAEGEGDTNPEDPVEIIVDETEDTDSDDENLVPSPVDMSLPKEVKEGWDVLPSTEDTSMRSKIEVGKTFIAHKFDDWMSPWDIGKVVPPTKRWKQKPGDPPPDEFYVKYPSENVFYPHELKDAEYGEEKTWVIVRKAQHVAKAPLGKSSHKPGTTQPPPPASAGAADPSSGAPSQGAPSFCDACGGRSDVSSATVSSTHQSSAFPEDVAVCTCSAR